VCEEALPEELKSIEAALAGLAPRADRLDRQRLMFLAGQASVLGRTGPRSAPAAWVWPSTAAVMTAVAATLLVMLIWRPVPQVVQKIVYLPTTAYSNNGVQPEEDRRIRPADGEDVAPPPRYEEFPPVACRGAGLLVSILPVWLQYADGDLQNSQVSYYRLRDRVLNWGVDSWAPPLPMRDAAVPAPPAGYRELLEALLDERA